MIVHTPWSRWSRRRVLSTSAAAVAALAGLKLAVRSAAGPGTAPAAGDGLAAPPLTPTTAVGRPLAIGLPVGGPFAGLNHTIRHALDGAIPKVTEASGARLQLEILEVPQSKQYSSQAYAMAPLIGSGAPPDLLVFTGIDDGPGVPGAYAVAAETKFLAPLDGYLKQEPAALPWHEFYPPALEACRHEGALHAMPLMALPTVLAYDRVRFREAGIAPPSGAWDWTQFVTAARRLTRIDPEAESGSVPSGAFGFWPDVGSGVLLTFIWQAGGAVVSADGKQASLTAPAAMQALELYSDLHRGPQPGSAPALAPASCERGPEGLRCGRWWCAMVMAFGHRGVPAWQVIADDPAEWPLALAEPPHGRRQAAALSLGATISLGRKAYDPDLASAALAALTAQLSHVVVPSARRQTPEAMHAAEPRLSLATARTMANALAYGHVPTLDRVRRTTAVLDVVCSLGAILRHGTVPFGVAVQQANTSIQRLLDARV
ncbi:MAG TPA: extracellular solute-binding protein [Chloroflexota bacterium]|jgi:hypothetical protein|nr:extracellular solute-binding protein [Chloroflexota bacterium]